MKIFVIVVTYNGETWIDKCFGSLRNSTIPVHSICIDNNSADASVQNVLSNFPEVELISLHENLGFGKANNIGIKKAIVAGADYVFLLNQDAWVNPDTIKTLVDNHLRNIDYGVLSPIHLNGKGDALDENFANNMRPEITPGFLSDTYLGCQKLIYRTSYVNAAAWLVSKACLERVGGFDPIFSHYGEDDDYLNRVSFHGFSVGIVPQVVVFHDRTCKPYSLLRHDINRATIADILKVKNTAGSFRSNVLVYTKGKIDILTSLILFRRFNEFRSQAVAFINTMFRLKLLYRSYVDSKGETAFIK